MPAKRTVAGYIVTLVLILLSVPVFFYKRQVTSVYTFPVMGTIATLKFTSESENKNFRASLIVKEEFDKVMKLANLYDPASELSRLNAAAAAGKPFKCSDSMWFLLKRSEKAFEQSVHLFDITVKPLMDLWGFYRKKGDDSLPADSETARARQRVGFDKLRFDESTKTLFFTVSNMQLDLGGIAKGYAVDRAAARVIAYGVKSGVIDLGGNLFLLPEAPDGKKYYTVAIKDPADRSKNLEKTLALPGNCAVATSGDYERFVTIKGKRFGHIISPLSGLPEARTAVTVTAASALDADILSTTAYLGGEKLVSRLSGLYPQSSFTFAPQR